MNLSAETLHFIEEHRHDDVRTLALQGKKYPGVDMALAVTQISGRQIADFGGICGCTEDSESRISHGAGRVCSRRNDRQIASLVA